MVRCSATIAKGGLAGINAEILGNYNGIARVDLGYRRRQCQGGIGPMQTSSR